MVVLVLPSLSLFCVIPTPPLPNSVVLLPTPPTHPTPLPPSPACFLRACEFSSFSQASLCVSVYPPSHTPLHHNPIRHPPIHFLHPAPPFYPWHRNSSRQPCRGNKTNTMYRFEHCVSITHPVVGVVGDSVSTIPRPLLVLC